MKISKLKFIFLLLAVFINLQCNLKRDSENNQTIEKSSTCDSSNKVDLLIQDIMKKKYIYTIVDEDTNSYDPNRYNYLISDGFVKPQKIYFASLKHSPRYAGPDSIKVISIDKDSILNKRKSRIYLFVKYVNSDTTSIKLTINYSVFENITTTETTFNYYFEKSNCKWILKDSTFWNY